MDQNYEIYEKKDYFKFETSDISRALMLFILV